MFWEKTHQHQENVADLKATTVGAIFAIYFVIKPLLMTLLHGIEDRSNTREVPWSNQHVGLRRSEAKPTREEQDPRRGAKQQHDKTINWWFVA